MHESIRMLKVEVYGENEDEVDESEVYGEEEKEKYFVFGR